MEGNGPVSTAGVPREGGQSGGREDPGETTAGPSAGAAAFAVSGGEEGGAEEETTVDRGLPSWTRSLASPPRSQRVSLDIARFPSIRSDSLDLRTQRTLAQLVRQSPGPEGSPRLAALEEVDLAGGGEDQEGDQQGEGGGGWGPGQEDSEGGGGGQSRERRGKFQAVLSWTLGGFSRFVQPVEGAARAKLGLGSRSEAEPLHARRRQSEGDGPAGAFEGSGLVARRNSMSAATHNFPHGMPYSASSPAVLNRGSGSAHRLVALERRSPADEDACLGAEILASLDIAPQPPSEPLAQLEDGGARGPRGLVAGWGRDLASKKREPWGFQRSGPDGEGTGQAPLQEMDKFKYDPVAAALRRKAARESAKVADLGSAPSRLVSPPGEAETRKEGPCPPCWVRSCFGVGKSSDR